jgi:PAS domain S-box-containing protein
VSQDPAAVLAAVVTSAHDAIVSKTLDGVVTSWNRAAEVMFGYAAAEAVGRSITIIIPPERLHEEADILSRLRRGESIGHFETERMRKDGRRLPVSLTVSPVRDRDGRIVGISKIARDISERRRAEHALSVVVERLDALYRLADQVGRAKDIADVCDAAIDAVMAVGAARASVLLLDERGVMRFRAWRNLSDAYRAAVDGHSPWPRHASAPAPVLVEDARADATLGPLREAVAAEGIQALALVPLVNHGRLLGTFMISYDEPHAFAEAELRLAGSIAQHVAFGLARVGAELAAEELLAREQGARREAEAARAEAEQRRTFAEQIARLARVMNATLDAGAAGERVVDSALALFRANACILRLATPEGALVGIAFAGAAKRAFAPGHTIPGGAASVSGLAMMAGAPVWTDDVFGDPRLALAHDVRRGMREAGDRVVLAAPLRHQGKVVGALSIADGPGRRFAEAEAEALQAFADHAALALENARLYEHARRQQREAEVVAEATQRINASLDLQSTLERLVEGARELCGGDIARIVVRDPATGRMLLRHQLGVRWPGYTEGMVIEPGRGSGGIVLATGRPFRTECYVEDARITAHYRRPALADGTVAQIVAPVRGEAGIEGLLYVDRRERRPFTDADEAILMRLADHAATAIRNAQLFAAEQAARAEADAANRAKDRFLAILSHELRTPLNAILGWARLLRAGHLDTRQHAHAVGVIERNALLQAQLVSDLLDISRIAAGKAQIERVPVDLVLVVREAIEAVTAQVAANRLTLTTEIDESAGEVLGEARRLQQVASNLILNAVKFTPPGGRVEVRLVRHETSARLTVTDSGEGIDPLVLPSIFDPFEQGDSSSTRRHQGLGLGLAIVRQFVELHGGTVRAESTGRGQGATFTVDLPVLAVRVSRADGEAAGTRSAAAPGLHGMRILIVDDQADARELLALVLAEHGATVQAAGSASEAIDLLAGGEIDVLVSDLSMPETDGFALIRGVRALATRARPLRAVAVTAYTGHEVREHALAAGFDAHATKPLNPEELVRTLRALRAS